MAENKSLGPVRTLTELEQRTLEAHMNMFMENNPRPQMIEGAEHSLVRWAQAAVLEKDTQTRDALTHLAHAVLNIVEPNPSPAVSKKRVRRK